MANDSISYTGDKDFDEILDKCFRIMRTKALDYASETDRLSELRATSDETGISMRATLGVYMNKHLRSLFKWIRGEELKGEPIEEKLVDIIVYSLLGYKLAREERTHATRGVINTAEEQQTPPQFEKYRQSAKEANKILADTVRNLRERAKGLEEEFEQRVCATATVPLQEPDMNGSRGWDDRTPAKIMYDTTIAPGLRSRCWGCCQENCGTDGCKCDCHG